MTLNRCLFQKFKTRGWGNFPPVQIIGGIFINMGGDQHETQIRPNHSTNEILIMNDILCQQEWPPFLFLMKIYILFSLKFPVFI